MPRHTVIPSRVLIVISTVVVALVLLLASSVQATSELQLSSGEPAAATAEYKVLPGDNLWDIADEHTPDGFDVRNTVETIKHLNDLGSNLIHPGQVLEIPLLSSG